MPSPTIFIGLGTSGLRMLEHTQRLYYEALGVNKPHHVEFLFIETDAGVTRNPTPAGDSIISQFIPLKAAKQAVDFLKQHESRPDIDWLPQPELLTHQEAGAGGMRAFGRLALWSVPPTGAQIYLSQLEQKLRQAHQRLNYAANTNVVIASSLAGGTGSGTFIDVAYLARFCLQPDHANQPNIYGFFLLPPSYGSNSRMLANAYACLHDLQYYSQEQSQFMGRWPVPSRPSHGFPKGQSPYKLATFMSPDWGGSQTVPYEDLVKLASVFLFAGSLGFNDFRAARIVDAQNLQGQGQFGKYSFVSLSALVYPKLAIEEATAVELSLEYLRKLIDPQNCSGHRIAGNIEEQANKHLVEPELDRMIRSAFELMSDAGPESTLEALITKKLDEYERNAIADPHDDLLKLFRAGDGTTIYDMVRPKVLHARQNIIGGVTEMLRRNMEDSASLGYGRKILSRCINYLRATVEYWRAFQIENWNTRAPGLVTWALSHRARYVPGEKKRIQRQRLESVLELVKMHHLLAEVQDLCKAMSGEAVEAAAQLHVPSLTLIDEMSRAAAAVSAFTEDSANAAPDSLEAKKMRLSNRGRGFRQIHEHYPSGSFAGEVQQALARYRMNPDPNAITESESRRVFEYNTSLWDHLISFPSSARLRAEMFQHSTQSYMRRIRAKNCVPGLDIAGVIAQKPEVLTELAEYAVQNPIQLNRVKQNAGDDYPKVIITSDPATQDAAAQALRNRGCNHFENNGPHKFSAINELNNMIIFLDERSDNFEPLDDITNANVWRQHFAATKPGVINAYGTPPPMLALPEAKPEAAHAKT